MATIKEEKALDVVRQMVADGQVSQEVAEKYFPELKESEDERIRNLLYCLIRDRSDNRKLLEHNGVSVDMALAWIEKQGGEKHQYKSRPRYVGETELLGGQNHTWSEEDEEMHRKCICAMRASACGFPEEEKFVEQVDNWLNSFKDRVLSQPRQEWSEEDMSKVQRICKYLDEAKKYYADITEVRECVNWLKSIKDRVQPKQEWSKEDEGILLESISVLQNNSHWILADKLKSLKDKVQLQNRWKPNGLDILLLERIANGESNPQDFQASLDGLILQLKKLREE